MTAASPHQGELDATLDALPQRPARPRGLDDPQMPFETNLRLTKTQEDRLMLHLEKRRTEIELEVERSSVVSGGEDAQINQLAALHAQGVLATTKPWMVRRALYYRHFYNNYQDRLGAPDSIFARSNVTASLSPRVTMQVAGKIKNNLFGSAPWFSAAPVGNSDEEIARNVREFTRYKATKAELDSTEREAVDLFCILGESVVKTVHLDLRQWYWKEGAILVNARGEPKFDSKGQYVWEENRFVPEMVEQQPDPSQPPVLAPSGRQVLRRDNSVVLEEGDTYKVTRVRVGDPVFQGAKAEVIRYTDFLCPLSAPSVDAADVVFHLYDKPAMEVASWFLQGRFQYLNQQQVEVKTNEALKTLREIAGLATMGPTGQNDANNPRGVHGESVLMPEGSSGTVNVVEAWIRFDADEDGYQEELVVLYVPGLNLPLYYEYTALVTADKRRPFVVQRAFPVHGRWYGVGIMEYLECEQQFIDLLVNRWNMTVGQTGSVTFWDPSKTVEGLADKDLVLNTGATYRLQPGILAEDVLKVIEVYASERAPMLKEMIEFFMQLLQLKTGVISVGDESIANIESTKLATGIRAIEKSGSELFSSWLGEAAKGTAGTVRKFVSVTLVKMDPRETWEFTEGENKALLALDQDDVLDLEMNVELLLVNDEAERVGAATDVMIDTLAKFYSSIPAGDQQVAAAPIIVTRLRALKIPNPDKVVVPMMPMLAPIGGAPGAPAASPGAAGQGQPEALPDVI